MNKQILKKLSKESRQKIIKLEKRLTKKDKQIKEIDMLINKLIYI